MSLGLVTIAAFLLLLPGVAFIVGVNFADKNIREIVFRNTPAEIGYVVFVSVVVHLALAILHDFNVARLYIEYKSVSGVGVLPSVEQARVVLVFSLSYVLVASVLGFIPGFLLGRAVRVRSWRWTNAFVKHRWMLDLVQGNPDAPISARIVMKDAFPLVADAANKPVVIQGIVRDSFFGADGKLLYLVFKTWSEVNVASQQPNLEKLAEDGSTAPQSAQSVSQLFIDGENIAMAYYFVRPPLPLEQIEAAPLTTEQ